MAVQQLFILVTEFFLSDDPTKTTFVFAEPLLVLHGTPCVGVLSKLLIGTWSRIIHIVGDDVRRAEHRVHHCRTYRVRRHRPRFAAALVPILASTQQKQSMNAFSHGSWSPGRSSGRQHPALRAAPGRVWREACPSVPVVVGDRRCHRMLSVAATASAIIQSGTPWKHGTTMACSISGGSS